MNRPLRLDSVAALLIVCGGVLLLSIVNVFIQFGLMGVGFARPSGAFLPWAILTFAAVAGAARSLLLLLDWVNTETPPWLTEKPKRIQRIAVTGVVGWAVLALAWMFGEHLAGEWSGGPMMTAVVAVVSAGVSAVLFRVAGKLRS